MLECGQLKGQAENMKNIDIKKLKIFEKYSLDQILILIVVFSLFIPFHFAAIPMIIISAFALLSPVRLRNILNVPNSWCIFGVIPVSLTACIIFGNTVGIFITLALFFAIAFALYARSVMDYSFFTKILDMVIGLSMIPAVIGAFQKLYFLHVLRPKGVKLPFDGRVSSVFSNPNYYAYIINLIILITIFRMLNLKKENQGHKMFFYSTILLLNLVALVLTNCRSTLISLIVGVVILTVAHKKYMPAIILLIAYIAYLFAIEWFPDIFPRMDFLYLDNSFTARLRIWDGAFLGIKESPLIGQGALAYKFISSKYPIPQKAHAHNLFIDSVLNFGIIGTSLIIMYFIRSIKLLYKNTKKPSSNNFFMFMIAVLASTLVHGITDVTVLGVQSGIMFCIIVSGFGIKKASE